MVMVHFSPNRVPDTVLGELYGLSNGRASVLFVLLAGVGVALLAGRSSDGRSLALVRGRLVLRGALLLPLGLWLQQLDHGVLVILQYYAIYFLLAALIVSVSDRWLVAGAVVVLACGPLAYLAGGQIVPEWYAEAPAMLGDTVGKLARDLLLSGAYPLVTWIAPLLAGLWVGRRDLSSPVVRWRLFVGGILVALVAALVASLAAGGSGTTFGGTLGGPLGGPAEGPVFASLLSNEPHSQMPLWMAGSIGSACAVLGGMLLLADRLVQLLWPLVATGQMALSVYVGHLLFLSAAAGLVRSEAVSGAFFTVGVFMLVVVLSCVLWRTVFQRGPLEAVLVAPWRAVEKVVERTGKGSSNDSV